MTDVENLENENKHLRELYNKLSSEMVALKGDRDPKHEPIYEAGFDHPCKQTCSGWKQGFERGQFDLKEIVGQHAVYKIALESIARNGDAPSKHVAATALGPW